jgi:uncharacterized protein with FMN-binding domain
MRKTLVTIAVMGIFIVYGLFQRSAPALVSITTGSIPTPTPDPTNNNTNTPTSAPAASAPVPTVGNTVAPTNSGMYKDGVYTGSQADAFYGTVQVQATVSGGRLTDVRFLQYPNDRRTSQMINSQAMGMLKNEAIQAQNANVDTVSGATDTSMAFIQSLSSALQNALA